VSNYSVLHLLRLISCRFEEVAAFFDGKEIAGIAESI
jgi:hypothetical protein